MSLSPQDVAVIVSALQDSDWDQAVVTIDGARIAVSRNGVHLAAAAPAAPVAPAPAPLVHSTVQSPPTTAESAAHATPVASPVAAPLSGDTDVTAPSVGVFWSSPEPGAEPFVSVGDRVEAGAILCIVEVMKLMTNVYAPAAGTVSAVLVGNGENVEFGTPLFRLREE